MGYILNLDEYTSIATYWIAFYVIGGNVPYFDSFGVEHIPNKFIGHKNITTIIH